MSNLTRFKVCDIGRRLGVNFKLRIAYWIDRAFAWAPGAMTYVSLHDGRVSSEGLPQAVTNDLIDIGFDVFSLEFAGKKAIYFA